jgi:hypothetical protein
VIQIESPHVVLVGLAFTAVLADDHSGHCLEDLAGAHDGPRLELSRRHRTLAGRRRNPDQIPGRALDVFDVSERLPFGDDDVGAERERHDDIGADGRGWLHRDASSDKGEINLAERELGRTDGHAVETICPGHVGEGSQFCRGRHQVDCPPRSPADV